MWKPWPSGVGVGGAPAAAAVPAAPGRHAGRGGPDPAGAAGQAADPRDRPADGRGGPGRRLRQRAALQRDLPAAVRPPARRPASPQGPAVARRRGHLPDPALSPALRLGRHAGLPDHARDSWASRWSRTTSIAGSSPWTARRGPSPWTPIGGDRLSVAVRFPRPSALPRILARVRGVFDLSADPVGIAEVLSGDPDLARMVALRPGLRVPGLGRVRAGGAGHPGPADHRRSGPQAGRRPDGRARRAAGRDVSLAWGPSRA